MLNSETVEKFGEPLRLRYRVMVYDGEAVEERLTEWFDDFAKNQPE